MTRRYVPRGTGRWVSTCPCGHRTFRTKREAKAARVALERAGLDSARSDDAKLSEFPCRAGYDGWHFGHKIRRGANLNDARLTFLPETA